MRIKKIEWITIDDKSDPSSPVGKLVKTADLPIGCVALIRQYQACYRWMIKVVDLSVAFLPPIEVGETDSIEGAKKACQATWEKMVMEAFEEEEGCEYCRNRTLLEVEHDLALWIGESTLHIRHIPFYERECEIDYCPICGRKLGGGK